MRKKYTIDYFVGTCVYLSANDLYEYDESSREITYKTFLRHVGKEWIREINESLTVPIHKDWHVSFSIGKWKGKKAICLFHSCIHHIWILKERRYGEW